jgi:polysaccharide export outer membrane protein
MKDFSRTLPDFRAVIVVLPLLLILASPSLAQERPISAGDAVNLTVAGQATLSRRFVVAPNGTLTLDLVGVVPVEGLTRDQFEADLRRRLTAFLVNPRVQVLVEPARRVFVFGAVPKPGSLDLTPDMTLLEALGQTGFTGVSEVIVVRPKQSGSGPAPIDATDAQVTRVNLRELEKELETGRLSRNLLLREGDSIYVPADDPNRVHVSGEVRKPGSYSIPDGTTVLQALSLAGGVTEEAAVGRLRVSRVVDGDLRSLKVSTDDTVEAGDTVIVPEKLTLPVIDVGLAPADPSKLPGRIHLGRAFSIRPVAAIKRFGVDNNVFNDGAASSDLTIVAGPRLETALDLQRLQVKAEGDVDFMHFQRFASERAINSGARASIVFDPVSRLRLTTAGSTADSRERIDTSVDARVRRFERSFDIGARVQPLRKLDVTFSGRDFNRVIGGEDFRQGVELRDTLTERVRSVTSTVRFAVTPLTDLVVEGIAATHRFALLPRKNADATSFTIGGSFKPGAIVLGDARIGYLRYLGLVDSTPDLETVFGSANLYWDLSDRTRLGVTAERSTGNAFQSEFAFALVDRAGGSIRRGLTQRFDILLEAYRERFRFSKFALPGEAFRRPDATETNQRYGSELGVRVRAIRVGINLTYIQRFSTVAADRDYHVMRTMINVSYGAFSARGL